MLLKLLEDKNGEVQNLAVKWWLCHFLGLLLVDMIWYSKYYRKLIFCIQSWNLWTWSGITIHSQNSPNAPLAQRVTNFKEIYMNAFISLNPIEIWYVFTWNIQQNLCYTIIWLSFHSGFSARSGGWENSPAGCSVSGIFNKHSLLNL